MATNWDEPLTSPHVDASDILDEFTEHQYFQEPADMFAALHEACAHLAHQRPVPPDDPFRGYTFGESTDVLAGDALLDAWNAWVNHLHELYGLDGDTTGRAWRFIRETRAICDAMLRRRGLSPDLDGPIGLRQFAGEEENT